MFSLQTVQLLLFLLYFINVLRTFFLDYIFSDLFKRYLFSILLFNINNKSKYLYILQLLYILLQIHKCILKLFLKFLFFAMIWRLYDAKSPISCLEILSIFYPPLYEVFRKKPRIFISIDDKIVYNFHCKVVVNNYYYVLYCVGK